MIADFREAEKFRIRRQNQFLWMQGQYIYEALCDVSPVFHAFARKGTKPIPYRSSPYPLFGDKEDEADQEQKEANEALKAKLYMRQMMRAGKNWGKGAEQK